MAKYPVAHRRGNARLSSAVEPMRVISHPPGIGYPKHWPPKPANDNWPLPANDNVVPPGDGGGRKKPGPNKMGRLIAGIGSMAGVQAVIFPHVGSLPNLEPGVAQSMIAKYMYYGNNVHWCANPGGFGPPRWSSTMYSNISGPGTACVSGQAIAAEPSPGATQRGMWRFSNQAQTRFAHILSLRTPGGALAPAQLPNVTPVMRVVGNRLFKPIKKPKPPPKGTKEKKLILQVDPRSPIGILINLTTEALDFLNAAYGALPYHLRAKWGYLTPQQKLQKIADNMDKINMGAFVRNLIINQVGDYIGGKVGKLTAKANRKIGHTGIAVGPAL